MTPLIPPDDESGHLDLTTVTDTDLDLLCTTFSTTNLHPTTPESESELLPISVSTSEEDLFTSGKRIPNTSFLATPLRAGVNNRRESIGLFDDLMRDVALIADEELMVLPGVEAESREDEDEDEVVMRKMMGKGGDVGMKEDMKDVKKNEGEDEDDDDDEIFVGALTYKERLMALKKRAMEEMSAPIVVEIDSPVKSQVDTIASSPIKFDLLDDSKAGSLDSLALASDIHVKTADTPTRFHDEKKEKEKEAKTKDASPMLQKTDSSVFVSHDDLPSLTPSITNTKTKPMISSPLSTNVFSNTNSTTSPSKPTLPKPSTTTNLSSPTKIPNKLPVLASNLKAPKAIPRPKPVSIPTTTATVVSAGTKRSLESSNVKSALPTLKSGLKPPSSTFIPKPSFIARPSTTITTTTSTTKSTPSSSTTSSTTSTPTKKPTLTNSFLPKPGFGFSKLPTPQKRSSQNASRSGLVAPGGLKKKFTVMGGDVVSPGKKVGGMVPSASDFRFDVVSPKKDVEEEGKVEGKVEMEKKEEGKEAKSGEEIKQPIFTFALPNTNNNSTPTSPLNNAPSSSFISSTTNIISPPKNLVAKPSFISHLSSGGSYPFSFLARRVDDDDEDDSEFESDDDEENEDEFRPRKRMSCVGGDDE